MTVEFYGSGNWMGHQRRDDSTTKIIAEKLMALDVEQEEATDQPEGTEEEEEEVPSSQPQSDTPKRRYEIYEQEHYTKKWKGDSEGAHLTE